MRESSATGQSEKQQVQQARMLVRRACCRAKSLILQELQQVQQVQQHFYKSVEVEGVTLVIGALARKHMEGRVMNSPVREKCLRRRSLLQALFL